MRTFSEYITEKTKPWKQPPPITQAQAARSNLPGLKPNEMALIMSLRNKQGWDSSRIAAYFDRETEDIEGVLRDMARVGKGE